MEITETEDVVRRIPHKGEFYYTIDLAWGEIDQHEWMDDELDVIRLKHNNCFMNINKAITKFEKIKQILNG
jgi:hypothetical protein